MTFWQPEAVVTNDCSWVPPLQQAYRLAWHFSQDPRTKNGAVLVHEYRNGARGLFAHGANCFPPELTLTAELLEPPEKYKHIIHAEEKSLRWAEDAGLETANAFMVSPWAPCYGCAERIVDAGIGTLVAHAQALRRTPKRWRDTIERAVEHLAEHNIGYLLYDGPVGGVTALLNGEYWAP